MAVRRRRANPIVTVGALVLAVVVFLVLVRAVTRSDGYPPQAIAAAESSAKLGRDVAALRTQLKDIDRLALFRKLKAWENEAAQNFQAAGRLEPPADWRAANGYLLTSLGLRAEAMRKFNPSVRNALSDRDIQVAASQLLGVMNDLELADRAYELFEGSWGSDAERKPPESRWVADADDATITGVTEFVRELRNQDALEASFNLTIASVNVDPKAIGNEGDHDLLPFSRTVGVTVVVKNTGNQSIPAVPVAAIITSETDPEPYTVEGTVGALRPGEQKSVALKGLEATAGGPVNLLKVTVGPAPGERNTLDNTHELKFAMRKP